MVMEHRTERLKEQFKDKLVMNDLQEYKDVISSECERMKEGQIENVRGVVQLASVLKALAFARTLERHQYWKTNVIKIVYCLASHTIRSQFQPEEPWIHPETYYYSKIRKKGDKWPSVEW